MSHNFSLSPYSANSISNGITEGAWNLRAQTVGLEASRSTIMREMLDLQVLHSMAEGSTVYLPCCNFYKQHTIQLLLDNLQLSTHESPLLTESDARQAVLSALEGRAIRARASALAGAAGFFVAASGGGGQDGSAWVRDLAPMLAEKQELISRCPAQLVGGIARARARRLLQAQSVWSWQPAMPPAGRPCRRNFPLRISIADRGRPSSLCTRSTLL